MDIKNIKVNQNKTDDNLGSAQYSLTYPLSNNEASTRKTSYEILSALKSDNDVIIEINSSLFNMEVNNTDSYIKEFLDTIRELELEYRYRKVTASGNKSIFSFVFGNKNEQAHEVLVYIPHEIWLLEKFQEILPICGVRYYINENKGEPTEILENMYQMMDIEKLDHFKLIIFDAGSFASMGINSRSLSLTDIKELLGI